MSVSAIAIDVRDMSDLPSGLLLEVRDSYFDRIKIVDQEVSKKRVRTYQALAAEILGFLAFLKIFPSFNLSVFHVHSRPLYLLLDVVTWEVTYFVILGFFFTIYYIFKIENQINWPSSAVQLDAKSAIYYPVSVNALIVSYLETLELAVEEMETRHVQIETIYKKMLTVAVLEITFMGLSGSVFLIFWLFSHF